MPHRQLIWNGKTWDEMTEEERDRFCSWCGCTGGCHYDCVRDRYNAEQYEIEQFEIKRHEQEKT